MTKPSGNSAAAIARWVAGSLLALALFSGCGTQSQTPAYYGYAPAYTPSGGTSRDQDGDYDANGSRDNDGDGI
jgi:hypothetical protein